MITTPQAALLREAAQNALITLDGIASANPRDKADFETPDEWIAWAKSRARFAADALRAPVAQEVYAERILRQMLHESDQTQSMQVEPVQAGKLPDGLALVVEKLERFQECSEDSGAGGCDIGREWFDALTTIGLLRRVQRSPGLWEMTASGSAMLARAALSARKPAVPMTPEIIHMIGEQLADCCYGPAGGPMECYQFEPGALVEFVRAIEGYGIGLEVKPSTTAGEQP